MRARSLKSNLEFPPPPLNKKTIETFFSSEFAFRRSRVAVLAPAYLSRGMSKRREPDSNSDGLDVEKLEPQAKRLITALSQRFSGPRQAMTLDQFRQHVHECGFPVSKPSLLRWRAGLSLDPNYFAAKRIPGRPRSLTHEDEELLGGFILHQNRLEPPGHVQGLGCFCGPSWTWKHRHPHSSPM